VEKKARESSSSLSFLFPLCDETISVPGFRALTLPSPPNSFPDSARSDGVLRRQLPAEGVDAAGASLAGPFGATRFSQRCLNYFGRFPKRASDNLKSQKTKIQTHSQEDARLLELVAQHGAKNWSVIATVRSLGGRERRGCAEGEGAEERDGLFFVRLSDFVVSFASESLEIERAQRRLLPSLVKKKTVPI